MQPFDVQPRDLMAALEAFAADRKLETQGKAIRVLVTDRLSQLGYLKHSQGNSVWPGGPVHRSSNGDDWLLATDRDGNVLVIHRANRSSGGTVTTTSIEEFLERNGDSPEALAVRSALIADHEFGSPL